MGYRTSELPPVELDAAAPLTAEEPSPGPRLPRPGRVGVVLRRARDLSRDEPHEGEREDRAAADDRDAGEAVTRCAAARRFRCKV